MQHQNQPWQGTQTPSYSDPQYAAQYGAQQRWQQPMYPPKKKSKLPLILGLVIGVPVLLFGAIIAATVLFVATSTDTVPTQTEMKTVMTIDDLSPWVVDFTPNKSLEKKTRTTYFDDSYDITYEYEHGDELYLYSSFTGEGSADDAKYSYSGIILGGMVADNEIEEISRNDLFSWGDKSEFAIMHFKGEPIGNCFAGRKGGKVFHVVFSGVYFDDAESIRELFIPVLNRVEAHK